MTSTADVLEAEAPTDAFFPEPFDWTLRPGEPAWAITVGISEQRLLDLDLPATAFKPGTDCWQVITTGRASPGSNVKLVNALGPDVDAARIRAIGQLDVLRLLATGRWR